MDSPSNRDGDVGCPVKECTLEVDIRIVSSDSITLGAHMQTLAFFKNFPSLPKSEDNVINLEEGAEVLQVLLRFMHNAREPDLGQIPFPQLFSVAEAAEKYLVYSAMERCKIQMEIHTSQEPSRVWVYAVKYDYPSLANKAAHLTLDLLPTEVLLRAKKNKLDEASVMQWHRYREQWSLLFALVLKRYHHGNCEHWQRFQFNVICDIGNQLTALMNFQTIVAEHRKKLVRKCCFGSGGTWSAGILKEMEGLVLYSDCLESRKAPDFTTTFDLAFFDL